MSADKIHNIVRGVSLHEGRILLAWHTQQLYYFLPGGHVEPGEAAQDALVRECREEFAQAVTCGDFLLLFEHAWQNGDTVQHELTSVFLLSCDPEANLVSQVSHLEFRWVALSDLPTQRFLPKELQGTITDIARGEPISPFITTMR